MKNTIDAVKYGIDTLKVSPEEMFSLIESSNGYEGEDYKRWLANEIIKLAEVDGVGYSQLLVKKFAIISEIIEGVDVSIKQEWVDMFKAKIKSDMLLSINFEELGDVNEDIDWYSNVDLLADKMFSDSELEGTDILENLYSDVRDSFAFVAKLETDSADKSSELFKDAKSKGITCKNTGSLLLYRMCNLADAWDLGKEFTFAFFVNVNFLCDVENKDVISHFLRYYDYSGFVINSVDLLNEAGLRNDYAFIVCSPKTGSGLNDGFILPRATIEEDKLVLGESKRYSRSSNSMLSKLIETAPKSDCVVNETSNGSLVEGVKVKGVDRAYGYLNIPSNNSFDCSVSILPEKGSSKSIAIVEENLKDVVVYYSVVHSLGCSGLAPEIKEVMTGSSEFNNLFYNCLPLFLFNTTSLFRTVKGYDNNFSVQNSELMDKLLDEGEVYFAFESKELLGVCKGFLDFLGKDCSNLTFEEVRKEANHPDLNSAYISALLNIKDYIRLTYKKVE